MNSLHCHWMSVLERLMLDDGSIAFCESQVQTQRFSDEMAVAWIATVETNVLQPFCGLFFPGCEIAVVSEAVDSNNANVVAPSSDEDAEFSHLPSSFARRAIASHQALC